MTRPWFPAIAFLTMGFLTMGFLATGILPTRAEEPVFDDQAMHPMLLPRGSMEYELALQRREKARMAKPSADAAQISDAMAKCDDIGKLSPATREKCEIRARQAATAKKQP